MPDDPDEEVGDGEEKSDPAATPSAAAPPGEQASALESAESPPAASAAVDQVESPDDEWDEGDGGAFSRFFRSGIWALLAAVVVLGLIGAAIYAGGGPQRIFANVSQIWHGRAGERVPAGIVPSVVSSIFPNAAPRAAPRPAPRPAVGPAVGPAASAPNKISAPAPPAPIATPKLVQRAPDGAAAARAASGSPELSGEVASARAALRELGIDSPNLADGVRILAARNRSALGAPAAGEIKVDCQVRAGPGDLMGSVYFAAGSAGLDAFDIALLSDVLRRLHDGHVSRVDVIGFADVGAGESADQTCASPASPNAELACLRARTVAGAMTRRDPSIGFAAAAAPKLEVGEGPQRCSRRVELRAGS